MQYLIDTSVVIDFLRGKPGAVAAVSKAEETGIILSTVSIAELYYGAEKSQNPDKNKRAMKKFSDLPAVRVQSFDEEIAVLYGGLMHRLDRAGLKLAVSDVLIATTAFVHKATILTADKKHFVRLRRFGIQVETIE